MNYDDLPDLLKDALQPLVDEGVITHVYTQPGALPPDDAYKCHNGKVMQQPDEKGNAVISVTITAED